MSRSMHHLDASKDNFSRNNDNGWAVEKTLLKLYLINLYIINKYSALIIYFLFVSVE